MGWGPGKEFLDLIPEAWFVKDTIEKLDLILTEKLCSVKDTERSILLREWKDKLHTNWEKIVPNHTSREDWRSDSTDVCRDGETASIVCHWWDGKWQSHDGSFSIPYKSTHATIMHSSNCALRHVSHKHVNTCSHRNLYMHVYSSFIHSSQTGNISKEDWL